MTMESKNNIVPIKNRDGAKEVPDDPTRRDFSKILAALGTSVLVPPVNAAEKLPPDKSKGDKKEGGKEDKFAKDELTPYSETELKSFYATHMSILLEEELFRKNRITGELDGKHPIKELNERVSTLFTLIKQRYDAYPQISPSSRYHKLGTQVSATNEIVNGTPMLQIIVPVFMDFYAAASQVIKEQKVEAILRNTLEATLRNTMTISIIHELDHLAFDPKRSGRLSIEDLNQMEIVAWAQTCQHTIRLFVENVEKVGPIWKDERETYQAWVNAGGTVRPGGAVMNKKWHDFIKEKYAATNAKRF